MNKSKESKIVEIWLTKAEKDDSDLQERLKRIYQKYKNEGYIVVTYQSGSEDLGDLTSALLISGRRRMAEME